MTEPVVDSARAQRIAEIERRWVEGWEITVARPDDDKRAREHLVSQLVAVRDWAQPHTPLPVASPPGDWPRNNQALLWLFSGAGILTLVISPAAGAILLVLFAGILALSYRSAQSKWNRRLAAEQANNSRRGPLDTSVDQRKTTNGVQIRFTYTELNLIPRTNILVSEIRANRSWQSEFLDTQRVRLDLDEELRQVVDEVTKLHALKLKTGAEPPPNSPAWGTYQHHRTLFAQSEKALRSRVIVLSLYLDDLRRFDDYLEQLDQINAMQEVDLEIASLYMGIEHSAMSARQTASLSDELAMAREAVTAIIGSLSSSQDYLRGLNHR
ncbi:MAG: hypothetical protein GX610_18680 [Rhodococcus sp.]|nr:hypothetical protein [Rhodococcus sp. (in: high G+C Gram-positive bacteria)]